MAEIAQSSYFKLTLSANGDKALTGSFEKVSGLGMQFEYESYLEGGANVPIQFIKNTVEQRLILEYGTLTDGDVLTEWMKHISSGITIKLTGSVSLCDNNGNAVRVWLINNAYPVRYIGPELDSNTTAPAVSRLELIYGGCS